MNLKKNLTKLLKLDDTPPRTALAFSIGVFLGFSPFLGLHTILALAIAFLLGYNRLAILVGLYVNTPWTAAPYYAFATWFGALMLRYDAASASSLFTYSSFMKLPFWEKISHLEALVWPMMVGSTILALVAAFLSYPLARRLLRRERR
ncbi:MAG: DUF2062 domain-containing protein [Acidobacteria bacterium]|nr:DUF2062 domain-containing protein [Acidobacteriota bacterium]